MSGMGVGFGRDGYRFGGTVELTFDVPADFEVAVAELAAHMGVGTDAETPPALPTLAEMRLPGSTSRRPTSRRAGSRRRSRGLGRGRGVRGARCVGRGRRACLRRRG